MPKRIQIAEKLSSCPHYLARHLSYSGFYLSETGRSAKSCSDGLVSCRGCCQRFPFSAATILARNVYRALCCPRRVDLLMRHSSETSLILSLISVSGDVTVALAVQHYSRRQDDFRKVCVWLISTLIISALAGMAAAGWLSSRHPVSFADTTALWWAANVSGNIVATTILTGLTWEPARKATGTS